MRIFPSKLDWWLAVLLFGLLGFSTGHQLVLESAGPFELMQVLPLALAWLLVLWIYFDTRYIVTTDHLKVICGPLRRTIPLKDITEVRTARALWSSPALSLDRVAIHKKSGLGVLISPHPKEEFIRVLQEYQEIAGHHGGAPR